MKNIDDLLVFFERRFGRQNDSTDPRFLAVSSSDPVELDMARALYALVRLTKAHTIVETGTNVGVSTLSMAKALKDDGLPGSQILTYDIRDHGIVQLAKECGLSDLVQFHQENSLNSNLTGQIAKIDILFLDSLPSLLDAELHHFWPFLRRSSLIVVHDSRLFEEKRAAIDRFLKEFHWSCISTQAGRGLTILSPGQKGVIAKAISPSYNVIVDMTSADTLESMSHWPIPILPEQAFLIGKPNGWTRKVFDRLPLKLHHSLCDAFKEASQYDVTHILYWNSHLSDAEHHLNQAWLLLSKVGESTLDYITSPEVPRLPWYKGELECELLLQRWRLSNTNESCNQKPTLSENLFFVNTVLLRQIGGVHPIRDDLGWTVAEMAARLIVVGATFAPTTLEPTSVMIPKLHNPQANYQALRSVQLFYQRLSPSLRQTVKQNWRRFVRVYFFGNGIEPISWRHLVSRPSSIIGILSLFLWHD